MAKHTITHACGHNEVHQLYGRVRDRDYQETRLAARECSECERARWLAERAAENAAAAHAAQAEGLPALQGTDRQVPWAESIRRSGLDLARQIAHAIVEEAEQWAARGDLAPAGVAAVRAAMDRYVSHLEGQVHAGWWIDRREALARWRLEGEMGQAARDAIRPHQTQD